MLSAKNHSPLQPSGDLQPDAAVLAGCYSLLFRRHVAKKARIAAVNAGSVRCFFPGVSAKTAAAAARQ
jgi:hypothetical protein